MTKHARLTLLAALLAAAWLLPFRGQDPADLLPVQTLVMDCREGQVYLYGDGGLVGQGASPAQAMDTLVQNAPGRAYLSQTEHLAVTQRALDQVGELYEAASLRLACGVFRLSGEILPKPEDLTDYLTRAGIKVRYMHSDVDTMERQEIIRDLRMQKFDVLVGINLLREGLDLPEVSLVAILDADKEGFLRSETSLIQTIGRAARNADGTVIMYADTVTPSMRAAITETERRRRKQEAYNEAHGIVPQTIIKSVRDLIEISDSAAEAEAVTASGVKMTERERRAEIEKLEKEMKRAAKMLEFEYAAILRDRLVLLRGEK